MDLYKWIRPYRQTGVAFMNYRSDKYGNQITMTLPIFIPAVRPPSVRFLPETASAIRSISPQSFHIIWRRI